MASPSYTLPSLTKGVVTMLSWMRLSPLALIALISLACSSGQKTPPAQATTAQLTNRPAQQTAARPVDNTSQQQIAAMQAELAAREARIKELEAARAQSANKDSADPQIAGVASTYDKAKRELALMSIAIVDYGMANLRSVQKAFEQVGFHADIISQPEEVAKADKIVLPGVGAFQDAVATLRGKALDDPILTHIKKGKPFL